MSVNKLVLTILTAGLIFVLSNQNFAQTKTTKGKSRKGQPAATKISEPELSEEEKRDQAEAEQMEKEALYYAPIRYAIVYNDIFYRNSDTDELNIIGLGDEKYQEAEKSEGAERRMIILMLPEQFNRQNLIKVFELIKKRFPIPIRLDINVHTSLATVETPEETEMTHDSLNRRFRKQENKYKEAFYKRDADEENFCYVTSLLPYKNRWAYPFKLNDALSPC